MKSQGNTLDSLTMAGVLAAVLAVPGPVSAARAQHSEDAHEYVGARKCKSCHEKEPIGNQYGLWLESAHAKALESLATDQAKSWAKEAGVADPLTDEKRAKCQLTAFGVSEDLLGIKFTREEGVSCEACHGPGSD